MLPKEVVMKMIATSDQAEADFFKQVEPISTEMLSMTGLLIGADLESGLKIMPNKLSASMINYSIMKIIMHRENPEQELRGEDAQEKGT